MTPADLLNFERTWPRHSQAKENAIRARGLTPARYYQLLQRAAVSLDGLAHDAVTAHWIARRRAHTLPTFAASTSHSHPTLSTGSPA